MSFNSTASGHDHISYKIIKLALPVILNYVLKIFNRSLLSSTFPKKWKMAIIIPINKVPSPKNPSDYRPIALLCCLSKIFEKLIHAQITDYLSKNLLFDPLQSAFRPYHSTETTLLKLVNDISKAADNNMVTASVMFDFTKAFDRVNHPILIAKLRRLGFFVDVLAGFTSYLLNRSQAVIGEAGELSSWRGVEYGVPQGSVLGPILFILYINDISCSIHWSHYLLFADDLQIYLHAKMEDLPECLEKLKEDIKSITHWSNCNSLALNPFKTQAIIFSFSKNKNHSFPKKIDLVTYQIPILNKIKSLGVQLDSDLSWESQIQKVKQTTSHILYRLRFFRSYTDEDLRIKLVSSLVLPHLDYCAVVMGEIKAYHNQTLQQIQNSCIRYIFNINWRHHITPYRNQLGWLSASDRRFFLAVSAI